MTPPSVAASSRPAETLPLAPAVLGDLVFAQDGSPLWPVRDDFELELFQELATLFGARCEAVEPVAAPAAGGEPPNEALTTTAEEVVALGEDAAEAGRLYAHLTQRRFRGVEDPTKRPAFASLPAVVVTTYEFLTSDLLEHLYCRGSADSSPGIICGQNRAELRLQALMSAAAARLCGPLRAVRTDVLPILPIEEVRHAGHRVLGGRAEAEAVREALRAPSGVLSLVTHTDGVDASLGPLTLCPMDRLPVHPPNTGLPPCIATDVCHRRDVPVAKALATGTLVPPEALTARILILYGCWGVRARPTTVDLSWTLARRLLLSPRIGALVTTWEVVLTNPRDVAPLADALVGGQALGPAVSAAREEAAQRNQRLSLCILGDPRVRLPAPSPGEWVSLRARSPGSPASPETDSDGAAFLRAYILEQLPRLPDRLGRWARRALRALEHYERGAWTGRPDLQSPSGPGPAMRAAVLDFMVRRGGVASFDWTSLAATWRPDPDREPCFACEQASVTYRLAPRVPGARERRIRICPQCGVVVDAPDGAQPLTIAIQGRSIHRDGPRNPDAWSAAVLLAPARRSAHRWWNWPQDASGAPAASFQPSRWPRGPSYVVLFEIDKATLSIARRPRALEGEPALTTTAVP